MRQRMEPLTSVPSFIPDEHSLWQLPAALEEGTKDTRRLPLSGERSGVCYLSAEFDGAIGSADRARLMDALSSNAVPHSNESPAPGGLPGPVPTLRQHVAAA